jgi:hypothetical protein
MVAQYATNDKPPMSTNFNAEMAGCRGHGIADHGIWGELTVTPKPIGSGYRLV